MTVRVGAIGGALVGLTVSALGAAHPSVVVLSMGALGARAAQRTADPRRASPVPAVLVIIALVSQGVIALADALALAVVAFLAAGVLGVLLGSRWLVRRR